MYKPTNWKNGDIITADKLNNTENGVDSLQTQVNNSAVGTNMIPMTNTTAGYVNAIGTISVANPTNSERFTDFIEVKPNQTYCMQVEADLIVNDVLWSGVGIYDSNKAFIARPDSQGDPVTDNGTAFQKWTMVMPDNAKYVRVSFRTYGNARVKFEKGSVATDWCPNPSEIMTQTATDNPIDAKIKGIAHRGFNIVAPEESKSAYILSKRNGYHHWEGDINWTKDNVPMMIHDLAINRTARNLDGSKISSTVNLTDLNYADLVKYDFGIVKGERFKGEPLLTFENLVKLARYNNAFLHIEFKYEFTQEQVQMLHNIVVKYNMLDRIGWQAFGWDWLKPMMALEPNGQYELLGGDVTDDYFTKMSALKTDTNTIIASQNVALSVDDIQKISDKGYPIYLWTVEKGDTVRKFRDIGMVEGIMTNGTINVADELTK